MPFQSCTTSRKMSDNQVKSGHFQLYSYPKKGDHFDFDESRYKRIAFISLNDFNGSIEPSVYPIKNRFNEPRNIKIGGIKALRAYKDILEEEYKDSLVLVDAGSFLHKTNRHNETVFLYNYLGVDVASLGFGELDITDKKSIEFQNYLQSVTSKAKFDILSSNLFNLREANQIKWKGISQYTIKTINGLKVGFLSVMTTELSEQIADGKINGIYIQNPPKSIITNANILRRKGAQVIVLLANKGLDCTSKQALEDNLHPGKVNVDPNESTYCNIYKSELYKTLNLIPPGTVDIVMTSGESSKVANFINGYPVLQTTGNGQFFSWAEIYFDLKHNRIDQSKTLIHQPIQICHDFLKESQDCYPHESLDHQEVTPALFLNKKIELKEYPKQ